MKPYGYRETDIDDFAGIIVKKTAERMRQKAYCRRVISETPPILINGLHRICREKHSDGDVSGCVEDECALIPRSEEY